MLRIRLSRTGKIRQPSYRVVVAEKDNKRDGRIVESIGHYNPLTNPAEFKINEGRALYWLSVGAQPSDAVRVLFNKQGTFDRLARLNAGESLDNLVIEYTGVAPVTAAKSGAAEPTPSREGSGVVGDAVEAIAVPVAAIVEEAEDVAETVIDKVDETIDAVAENIEDAVQAVIGADEEE